MVNNTEARHKWYKILVLGFCIYLWPALFERLGSRWYPKDDKGGSDLGQICNSGLLRRRFWRAAIFIIVIIVIALFVSLAIGSQPPYGIDWLRLLAVFLALLSALGRGGWGIQTYGDDTVVERVDRAMYLVSQLGVAALLILIMTTE